MIDTVRFKTQISPRDSDMIRIDCYRMEKGKREGKDIEYRVYNGDFEIGSFSRKINIFFPKNNQEMFFELSLPKYAFGNNVQMLYRSELPFVIDNLYTELTTKFIYFPHPSAWEIQRIDFCYNWKFDTKEEMIEVLNLLRLLEYPRKQKYLYDTSLMFRGKTYSVKFYQKNPEFLKHDYPALIKKAERGVFTDGEQIESAEKLKMQSENMLRYEVTMRKQSLLKIYDKQIIKIDDIINGKAPKEILKTYLDKLLKYVNINALNEQSALDKLKLKYRHSKAYKLFNFYSDLYSEDGLKKEMLKQSYSRSQFYKNKRDLRLAGLGVPIQNAEIKDLDFKFEIIDPYE